MAEIVGIVLGLVGPIIEIGKCVAPEIKRQFTYLFCFHSNTQSLETEAKNLENKKKELQMEIDAPENNGLSIIPRVETWIENAERKMEGAGEISNLKIGCWDIKSRYQLSRKAVKVTEEMKQLVEDLNKFDRKFRPPSPAARVPIPQAETHEFQSRKQIEDGIVEVLRANEIRIVGICGMGGVGKTTTATRIMNRVRDLNIFKETPMAVVGREVDKLKIQEEIAESLNLELKDKTLRARANILSARLTGADTKRILVVLDDVWETLKLDDLGIPCENEWCKILLTSRNRDVLKKMDAKKICGMEFLPEEEAWSLFREKVGTCVDDDENLRSVAESVAKECKGLPIALITVGAAFKNKNLTYWEGALEQLKSFNPVDVPGVIKEVYNPLKLSYTNLETTNAKSLFLLCSVFPEDIDISLEDLVSYCMGLRMFCDSNSSEETLENVRKRISLIIDMLKDSFLLLEGRDEHHVRMHDVVRDVAIYIASNETKEGEVDAKFNLLRSSREFTLEWVSLFSKKKKSNLLRMHAREKGFEIMDSSLFEEMEELNVLSFENISLKSLPMATQLRKNLRTLRLESCNLVEPLSLSIVGELLSLEILCCHRCGEIEELPVDIGKLIQLKLLDFSYCYNLRRIPPGVISKLVKLEKFKMLGSFKGWKSGATVQGRQRRNASLNEFKKLSKLTCLEIEINDSNLAAEEICFPPNIVNYYIGINDNFWGIFFFGHDPFGRIFRRWPREIRGMVMMLRGEIKLGSWVHRFLRSSNHLELCGDVPFSLDLPPAQSMKSLTLYGNRSTDKGLVNTTTSRPGNTGETRGGNPIGSQRTHSQFAVFPILEVLELSRLPNLEEILNGEVLDSSKSFNNLRRLCLVDMRALKHLCKRPDTSPVSLDKLEVITIRKCSNLVNLFSFTMYGQKDNASIDDLLCIQKVYYPKLKYLVLEKLDKLEVIWNSPIPEGSNSFKNIRKLRLFYLSEMTHLWKSPSRNISLSNLSKICVNNCHKLRSLFLPTMSMDFVLQLETLEIESCETMEQIMLLNEENENDTNRTVEFPKLSNLTLHSLESLTTFSKGIESIKFPKLINMSIKSCPKLTSLLPSAGNNQYSTEDHDNNTFHLLCREKVSFGSLKKITIKMDDKSNIWCHQIPLGFFNQLENLEITACNGIRNLFPFSMVESLVRLKVLRIQDCNEMVKVIEDNEEILCEKTLILFPSLKEVQFTSLPKLESFCNWRYDLQLSSLEEVRIKNCPLLEFFTIESVSFGNLKNIFIGEDDKSDMWCRQIPFGFVNQLEKLEITKCNGIKNLFSILIVENLVNLRELKISKCNGMVKVIEDNEEMLCGKSLTLFPNLNEIQLWSLPKLETFCNWRCDLQLPSMDKVVIKDCSLLESFSMGSVNTPKLKSIYFGWKEEARGDLNSEIQSRFKAKHQPSSTEKGSTSTAEQSRAEASQEESEIKEEDNIIE